MSTKTRAVCVIGWPVEHSRSPLIHNYWIKRYGIAGEYRAETVRPEGFASFIAELSERGYLGANIRAAQGSALRLSAPDEQAKAVGAANTLGVRTVNCVHQHRRRGLSGNLAPRRRNGRSLQPLGCSAQAAERARRACPAQPRVKNVTSQPQFRARAGFAERFGAAVHPIRWEAIVGIFPPLGSGQRSSLGMQDIPRSTSQSKNCRPMRS